MDNQTKCCVTEMILLSEDLPSPPGVALRLLELYNQPSVEVQEMAQVISIDPVLTAKLIAYCNSPLLARNHKTTSVENAIVVIGMRAVKILALSFSLVQSMKGSSSDFDYDKFWSRSLATAVVAKSISKAMNRDGQDEFLTGLMMSIGQIALAHTFAGRYASIRKEAIDSGLSIYELEKRQWGSNHLQVGTDLLRHWAFPDSVVEGIAAFESHVGHSLKEPKYSPSSVQVRIFALTNCIVEMLFSPTLLEADVEYAKSIGKDWFELDDADFEHLFNEATEAWTVYAVLLNFDASESQTFEQLERRALKGIAQLSIGMHAENTAMAQENAELKHNAMVDSLTGLKNRRSYDSEASAEWERSRRMDRPFLLLMIDIDHFKQVNDVHGHAIGDRVLVAVGKALTENARRYDSVYRIGGEEFVVMVPECQVGNAITIGNRYRKAIEEVEVPLEAGTLKVTASVGVAVSSSNAKASLESVLIEADSQLYKAKKTGRNRVCCLEICEIA